MTKVHITDGQIQWKHIIVMIMKALIKLKLEVGEK